MGGEGRVGMVDFTLGLRGLEFSGLVRGQCYLNISQAHVLAG